MRAVGTGTVVAITRTKKGRIRHRLNLKFQKKKSGDWRRNVSKPRQPRPNASAWRKKRRLWRRRKSNVERRRMN
jgi:hypothetical protein